MKQGVWKSPISSFKTFKDVTLLGIQEEGTHSPVQLVETHACDPLAGTSHAHHLLQSFASHHSL